MDDRKFLRRTLIILGILFLIRAAAGAFIPVFDPSEGRYASIAANMAASGDYLTPHFWHQGVYQSFDGKTPGFFWLAAFSIRFFGQNEFAVRLPSILASLALLWLMFFVLKRFRSPKETALALIFCGTAFSFFIFSGIVLTDVVLMFCISGAILCFAAFCSAEKRREAKLWGLAVCALLGLGFITKGPVAIVMFGIGPFVWLCIHKNWRKLKDFPWFTGIALFLLIAVPWFILKWVDDKDAVIYFFYNENFKRFVSPEYGDKYGAGRELHFGASVWMLLLAGLPWTLLLIRPLFRKEERSAVFARSMFADPLEGIMLYSFLGITAFWALTSRVLGYYMLPVTPCIAVWLACRIARTGPALDKFKPAILSLAGLAGLITIIGLIVVGITKGYNGGDSTVAVMPFAAEFLEKRTAEAPHQEVVFLRKDPYSADFYVAFPQHLLRHHPDETAQETLEKNPDALIIAKQHYLKRLEPGSFQVIGKTGKWSLIISVPKQK